MVQHSYMWRVGGEILLYSNRYYRNRMGDERHSYLLRSIIIYNNNNNNDIITTRILDVCVGMNII